jgi:hypothetical protein
VAWFLAATVSLSGATLVAADVVWPQLRDPEYGRRAAALRQRLAENPGRPLVLAVGTSRVAGAVCPAACETGSGPMFFNMGRAGAGPAVQLMTLRRVYADGFRPAVVLLEYWPPVVDDRAGHDSRRLQPEAVFPADLPVVRDYFPDGGEFERRAWRTRLNPIHGLRLTFVQQLAPEWLPWSKRTEVVWAPLDGWGWLPGLDLPTGPSPERDRWTAQRKPLYSPYLRDFRPSPGCERALREAVALARGHGAAVGFVFLPESGEFRSWYTRRADRAARAHLAALTRELNVPLIDARTWMADGYFLDGFRLTRLGAEEFTRKLAPAVAAAFPEVRP